MLTVTNRQAMLIFRCHDQAKLDMLRPRHWQQQSSPCISRLCKRGPLQVLAVGRQHGTAASAAQQGTSQQPAEAAEAAADAGRSAGNNAHPAAPRPPHTDSESTQAGPRSHAVEDLRSPGDPGRHAETSSPDIENALSAEEGMTAQPQASQPRRRQQLQQQSMPSTSGRSFMDSINQNRGLKTGLTAALVLLGGTLLFSVVRVVMKYNAPASKKKRNINKNLFVVESLAKYLPSKRQELTSSTVRDIIGRTGFSPTEAFRKYLWFALRERKFDQDAVDDLVQLKTALRLQDSEVADALKERAERIYKQYGNVMMDVAGMSKAGIDRKATCRGLFSKLLYLAESESLISQDAAGAKADVAGVFGATAEDCDQLRIVSLQEVDFDELEKQFKTLDKENEP